LRLKTRAASRTTTEIVLYPYSGEIILLDAKAALDEAPEEMSAA
jgi:hypothetical protein